MPAPGGGSSRARGVRMDETAPTEVEHTNVEPVLSTKEYRRRWAASSKKCGILIQSYALNVMEK